jgi:hypothetical protein
LGNIKLPEYELGVCTVDSKVILQVASLRLADIDNRKYLAPERDLKITVQV